MNTVRTKKYFLLSIFIIGLNLPILAQGNLPYVDGKFIHFGFSLGTNMLDFGVTPNAQNGDTSIDVSSLTPGFSVGIISDMRLHRYLNLRFTPTLHFGERTITYKSGDVTEVTTIGSIPMTLPLHLKYSAERVGNYRPYLLLGGGAYFDLNRSVEQAILLKPMDFYTEFGVGCDIYFSFFKLAPELKFAIGFNNMHTPEFVPTNPDYQKYTDAISKLTSRMLTLSFNFE
jgi:hypothetical protein